MISRENAPAVIAGYYAIIAAYAILGAVGQYGAAAEHHPVLFTLQPFVPFLAPLHGALYLLGIW